MEPTPLRSKGITSVATAADLEELMPLLRDYQDFYSITTVDEAQTRWFFGRVIASPEEGFIIVARKGGRMIGFATGYITHSGYLAARLVHLGDLFVHPAERRNGVGRTLIEAVSRQAQVLGLSYVRWLTSPTNFTAHRLYDSTGAVSSDHRLYLLSVPPARG